MHHRIFCITEFRKIRHARVSWLNRNNWTPSLGKYSTIRPCTTSKSISSEEGWEWLCASGRVSERREVEVNKIGSSHVPFAISGNVCFHPFTFCFTWINIVPFTHFPTDCDEKSMSHVCRPMLHHPFYPAVSVVVSRLRSPNKFI